MKTILLAITFVLSSSTFAKASDYQRISNSVQINSILRALKSNLNEHQNVQEESDIEIGCAAEINSAVLGSILNISPDSMVVERQSSESGNKIRITGSFYNRFETHMRITAIFYLTTDGKDIVRVYLRESEIKDGTVNTGTIDNPVFGPGETERVLVSRMCKVL